MKKVLSMMMVIAMVAALLTVSVFAKEPEGSATFSKICDEVEGTDILMATTNAPGDVTFEVAAAEDQAGADKAAELASEAGAEIQKSMNPFTLKPSKNGNFVVNVTIKVPAEFIGSYLGILVTEEGKEPVLDQSVKITDTKTTFTLSKFGTVSPIVTDKQLPSAGSPSTGNAVLPVVLGIVAVTAIGGVVFSRKRLAA